MLKMRGLTLLCLSGFILTASSVNRDKKEFRSQTYIKTGMLVPMNNGDSNTTTNSSMILEQSRQDNTSAELDGFLQPFVNSDGEDTQPTRAPHSIWNFLNSDSSFPPEEKVIQNKNEDGQ